MDQSGAASTNSSYPLPEAPVLEPKKKNFLSHLTRKQKLGVGLLGALVIGLPLAIFTLGLQTDLRSRAATSTVPPIISTASAPAGVLGQTYRFAITGQDLGYNNTLQMNISGVPSGLGLDSTTSTTGCNIVTTGTSATPSSTVAPIPVVSVSGQYCADPYRNCYFSDGRIGVCSKDNICTSGVAAPTTVTSTPAVGGKTGITVTPKVTTTVLGDTTTLAQAVVCSGPQTAPCCDGRSPGTNNNCGQPGTCAVFGSDPVTGSLNCSFIPQSQSNGYPTPVSGGGAPSYGGGPATGYAPTVTPTPIPSSNCTDPAADPCCLNKPTNQLFNCAGRGNGVCIGNSQNSAGQLTCNFIVQTMTTITPTPTYATGVITTTPTPITTTTDPIITSITPTNPKMGDVVTITGKNFMSPTSAVSSYSVVLAMPSGGAAQLAGIIPSIGNAQWSDTSITFKITDSIARSGNIIVSRDNRLGYYQGFSMNMPTTVPTTPTQPVTPTMTTGVITATPTPSVFTRTCTLAGNFTKTGTFPITVTLINTLSGLSAQKTINITVSGNPTTTPNPTMTTGVITTTPTTTPIQGSVTTTPATATVYCSAANQSKCASLGQLCFPSTSGGFCGVDNVTTAPTSAKAPATTATPTTKITTPTPTAIPIVTLKCSAVQSAICSWQRKKCVPNSLGGYCSGRK